LGNNYGDAKEYGDLAYSPRLVAMRTTGFSAKVEELSSQVAVRLLEGISTDANHAGRLFIVALDELDRRQDAIDRMRPVIDAVSEAISNNGGWDAVRAAFIEAEG